MFEVYIMYSLPGGKLCGCNNGETDRAITTDGAFEISCKKCKTKFRKDIQIAYQFDKASMYEYIFERLPKKRLEEIAVELDKALESKS